MTKLQVLRPWLGAIFAFVVVLTSSGHAGATTTIAFAMPMAIFFVCAVAYSSQKQIAGLQTELKELRASLQSSAADA